jgi:hypothetical protein
LGSYPSSTEKQIGRSSVNVLGEELSLIGNNSVSARKRSYRYERVFFHDESVLSAIIYLFEALSEGSLADTVYVLTGLSLDVRFNLFSLKKFNSRKLYTLQVYFY